MPTLLASARPPLLVHHTGRRRDSVAVGAGHRTTKPRTMRYCGVHLGYVPNRQRWIAEALDDGLRLRAIAAEVKVGWIFRRRLKFVGHPHHRFQRWPLNSSRRPRQGDASVPFKA